MTGPSQTTTSPSLCFIQSPHSQMLAELHAQRGLSGAGTRLQLHKQQHCSPAHTQSHLRLTCGTDWYCVLCLPRSALCWAVGCSAIDGVREDIHSPLPTPSLCS